VKYNKNYKINDNNIIILSILNKSIKIFNVNDKTLLLNYVQNYSIDNVLELYNGDILYINNFEIYNLGLNKEFKISLSHFCFCLINLFDKQNILGYTSQKYIKFIYLDDSKKVYKKIEITDTKEIFDVKQIYNENKNYNLLIILSSHKLDIYDLNSDKFLLSKDLYKNDFYKKINIDFNGNNKDEKCFIIGENSIKTFNYKENNLLNIHDICGLKNIKSSFYSKISTTPFCFTNNEKYIIIFESNIDGFNSL